MTSKIIALLISLSMLIGVPLTQLGTNLPEEALTTLKSELKAVGVTAPKYVFMFIGDGLSYPQIQAASAYLGAISDKTDDGILDGGETLSFMNFPVAGSATTYDSTSFCPDSASTATSIATGYKTYSGVLNMDETKTIEYETISEQLKEEHGFKIGIISSVNINHATPAAFYAHQPSRNNYYNISLELIESGFEYFAGGDLLQLTGKNNDLTNSYTLAEAAGYKVVKTQDEASKISGNDEKVIIIAETLADSGSLSYANDAGNKEWKLADYVSKGIEVLDNETGFFMMIESGKIDWACHANDAGSTIADTIAFSDAVEVAIEFAAKHPAETLILVTGDHETGGLTIGFAGTDYDTYLDNLTNQKISYAKFNSDYVSEYKENKTGIAVVLRDIETNFGLVSADRKTANTNEKLVLTDYELELLKKAYEKTINNDKSRTQEEYILYGNYEPLTVTITHLLNNKSGIGFTSYSHTALPVAVFALGAGQEMFNGYYDNTEIYHNLAAMFNID